MSFDITAVVNIMGLAAVAVFAISGALDAARQKMDILGFMLIGTATGIGGGTLRDVLLGNVPVFWIREPVWILICLVASAVTYFIAPKLASRSRTLIWMDAVGLALFAVVGTEIALEFGTSSLIAICMGVMTATFGGIARDVLCGSNLTLMNEELYITTALAGSVVYLLLNSFNLPNSYDLIGGFLVAFILRALAIQFHLKLPNPHRKD
ncbi:trimeric intracellular cation channel family protein [Amphritea balenae]|uniref:Trimeric intracellular cation channel family protein n=1 Tax=Amphritea balenae TaxID=452629 RepID=A0A3P1SV71_9GAMM|nr:trimeric intracellular cation channel family protein [Amphritea balenae]RRD00456.1 trimeric intracellular cation channel family protein [Amphritea balenae]GGK70659.1 membrane protein [Amphritea balenae]